MRPVVYGIQAAPFSPHRRATAITHLPEAICPVPESALDLELLEGIVTCNMRLRDFMQEVGRYRHGYLSCAKGTADLRLSQ